jgi:putative NAD(P)-binding protein
MPEIETDYLVVGAGATGMAFADTLIADSDGDVVMVDRRHRPGGHWLDAYPFVRLHQPSAYYGVNSRVLGDDRIDGAGPNAGFYERATAAEICDYFNRVLEEQLLPSGRVRFFPMCDYRGADTDGHHFVSRLTGTETTVRVRRKLVDATYVESSIPSRHTPAFEVDDGVRLLPPNALVDLDEAASGFTIIGAGKTAMDTCNWLLDAGVDPDAIRWVRPRDGWFFNRVFMQPLELVGSYMQLQARWVEGIAACEDATDFMHRLEADDVLIRIDPTVEPGVFRGATLSLRELDSLRSVEQVVRLGRVLRIGTNAVQFERGDLASDARHVYVDCTAAGLRPTPVRRVFEDDRITMQYVTIGVAPWSAATIAAVEAMHDGDDALKNALCPVVAFTGDANSVLPIARAGMSGLMARAADPAVGSWTEECRLNPARGAATHLDDPRVQDAFTSMAKHLGPALENLERVLASPV